VPTKKLRISVFREGPNVVCRFICIQSSVIKKYFEVMKYSQLSISYIIGWDMCTDITVLILFPADNLMGSLIDAKFCNRLLQSLESPYDKLRVCSTRGDSSDTVRLTAVHCQPCDGVLMNSVKHCITLVCASCAI